MKLLKDTPKLIHLYKWNNIFFQYFKKSIIFLLLPLVVLCMIVFVYLLRTEEESLINNQYRAFRQTTAVLESVFTEVDNSNILLSGSNDVFNYCVTAEDTPFLSYLDALTAAQGLMKSIKLTSQSISNVHIYSPKQGYVLSTMNGNTLEDFYLKRWYDIFAETGATRFLYYNKSSLPKIYPDSITVVRGLEQDGILYGIALYDISIYTIRDIINRGNHFDSLFLYDASGDIFYATDESLITQNVRMLPDGRDYESISDLSREGNLLIQKATLNGVYSCVSLMDLRPLRNIGRYIWVLLVLIAFVLAFSFVLSFYLSMQFYRSIIQITVSLKNGEESGGGELSESKYAELYYINSHIVSQLTKTDEVEKRLAEQVSALKSAQFSALQTQLNPHFIYNTLNSINIMVLNITKKDCDASRAIIMLSNLLRSALDSKRFIITLEEEIAYVKTYIELQRFRFQYSLAVFWDVDETLLQCRVIKFILQPIIENAFEHGFSQMGPDARKTLNITAHAFADTLLITVANNGAMISEDELKALQEKLSAPVLPTQKGIGLINVHFRIRLIYGEPYGCSITSGPTQTAVTISLPRQDVVV